uniref:Serum response factor-binding protein 1 n=1 Tax=Iconisemion striatum TaxID=60296 RepID=A0A1A7Y5A2_9TELE
MMNTEEKRLPPVEDEQKYVKEEDNDEEEAMDGHKSSDFDDDEGGEDENEKEEESPPFPADGMIPSPNHVEEKKKPLDVLNLNNEVVKMRKEVKRIKALIIRKHTRQIAALKKKKGKEADVERNQRRAERLVEEVHCMKKLLPDLVTKTALQKNLNFEQVCKNPKSTISDRAVARIATHPQFNKKIESIKAAVKSFKEEHMKGGKLGGNAKVQKQLGNATLPSPDTKGGEKNQKKQKEKAVKLEKDSEEGASVVQIPKGGTLAKAVEEMEKAADAVDVHEKEAAEPASVRSPSVKSPSKRTTTKQKPQSEAEKHSSDLWSALLHKQADEVESDVESSDNEEREYFDDSTEERFRRQSSQSEQSDDDDFFLGKVSKVKRKQQQTDTGGEKKKVDKRQEEKTGSTDIVGTPDKLQSELDELESRLKSKATALQTIFCSSLAGTKTGSDRGRGGGKFKGQHGRGVNRDSFSKQSKSQQQDKGPSISGSKYSRPCPEKDGRGRGRGRGVQRQKDLRGGHVPAHQPPLHPSWEASKKRKEQQGQILAFQGKKIKFDDDD